VLHEIIQLITVFQDLDDLCQIRRVVIARDQVEHLHLPVTTSCTCLLSTHDPLAAYHLHSAPRPAARASGYKPARHECATPSRPAAA
jgi:hypothetical protein